MSATELTLHLFDLHPTQERIRAEAKRFNVVALGRRAGKTTLGEDLVVETLLDDRAPCAWFGPNYKNLAETWRDLKHVLGPVTTRVNEAEYRLEVLGGGVLDCWSLDAEGVADSVRGRKYKRVVIDEAASVGALLEIFQRVIRPMLTDLIGDAWFFSTPKGLNGFYVLYQRGQDDGYPEWASWQAPTTDNPHLSKQEIEDARAELPERDFAQEYGAKFLSDGGGVFRNVERAATARWQDKRTEGHQYVIGADWAKMNDFTVFSVVDLKLREQCHLERFNQIDYHLQVARLRILAEKFKPTLIVPEANAMGTVVVEMLERMRLPVWPWTATNATVAAVVDALSVAFDRQTLRILPDKVQTGELLAYDAVRLPSGMLRYGAPEGMHDDCVRSLCLSWLAACQPTARPTQRDFRAEAG